MLSGSHRTLGVIASDVASDDEARREPLAATASFKWLSDDAAPCGALDIHAASDGPALASDAGAVSPMSGVMAS